VLLVFRRSPAAIDGELGPVVCGIRCGPAQGAEESWIKVGYTWKLVIEDRRTVGDGTVCLAKRSKGLAAKTTVLTARDVGG
jgi:hypothetical protein